ncbi:MAG: amidase family protein [Nanobdellota archaeon]
MKDFIKNVNDGKINVIEHIKGVLKSAENINNEYKYFTEISREEALKQAENLSKNPKGKLAGVAVTLKDAICLKNAETKAGSRILSDYKPVFDSTVAEKIKAEGGIIIGKTTQDEFGFGTFNVNTGHDIPVPLNPVDKTRACGGSSGGSGGIANIADFPHISLGESTGGSIVNPGSFCGVNALCPTYGRVSRWGLIDYGNSLDKIGPLAKSVYEIALMLDCISGHDKKDSTTLKEPKDDYFSYLNKDIKGMKVGIIKEGFSEDIDKPVRDKCKEAVDSLKNLGADSGEVSTPIAVEYGLPAYYMISTSEASTNLAKLCGIRYGISEELDGNFNDYFTKVRSKHFGKEAKRRIILGTFARMSGHRDAYYIKSAKIRTRVIQEYKELFKDYDVLVCPTVPILPPKFEDIEKMTPLQHYLADLLTIGPNLAGLPHINVTAGKHNGLPVGMTIIADHLNEGKLLQVAKEFEK